MSIFLTGDIHGDYRETTSRLGSKNFPDGKNLTKEDFVIVTGDFGWIWYPKGHINYRKDQAGIQWLNEKPWTTLFIDGNHENHDMLDELEVVDFYGGKAGKVSDSIYHLKRGEIFELNGKKVFVFGGARSSKTYNKKKQLEQIQGKNWWDREIPTEEEFLYALHNLCKFNFDIDIVLSHTAPKDIVKELSDQVEWYYERIEDPVAEMLDKIEKGILFKNWYFGHFHDNLIFKEKYFCLHSKIIEHK
jgi:hypothetical protein